MTVQRFNRSTVQGRSESDSFDLFDFGCYSVERLNR